MNYTDFFLNNYELRTVDKDTRFKKNKSNYIDFRNNTLTKDIKSIEKN